MLIVFGSINQDMYFQVSHLPETGEAVLCPKYETGGGGKGANQALAAARCGAKTALVGRVGDDGMGMRMLATLRREGVMTSGVAQSNHATGCSVVLCDNAGGREVVVALGANADTSSEQIPDEILTPQNIVLMQMEIPEDHNWDVVRRAHSCGAKTILNLAPAIHIPDDVLNMLDYLIVNELEARQISQKLGIKAETNAALLARALCQQGGLTCVVTIGERGAVAAAPDGRVVAVPPLKVDVVDVSGAGDAYCGTFAAAIHAGLDLVEAMQRSSVAGGLACTKTGAQNSFPHVFEIDEALPSLGEPQIEHLPVATVVKKAESPEDESDA